MWSANAACQQVKKIFTKARFKSSVCSWTTSVMRGNAFFGYYFEREQFEQLDFVCFSKVATAFELYRLCAYTSTSRRSAATLLLNKLKF